MHTDHVTDDLSQDCIDEQMLRVLTDTIVRSRSDGARGDAASLRSRMSASHSTGVPAPRPAQN